MTLISDLHVNRRLFTNRWDNPRPQPSTVPTLVRGGGTVVAMRRRPVVALGALGTRRHVVGNHLVSALDADRRSWLIAADAVWSDGEDSLQPQRPRPVGLAMAATTERAITSGLSDRLGWEAVLELERGRDLPVVDANLDVGHRQVAALDGRLDHGVPTIVLLGDDMVRWGAGATWEAAMRRAMYGDDPSLQQDSELTDVAAQLADQGLRLASVDLGTSLLRQAGIVRCSVQLLADA